MGSTSDTLSSIATGLKNAVNADAALSALGVTATNYGQVLTVRSTSETATTYEQSTNSGATEKIALCVNQNALQRIAISGTKTTGDTITITIFDHGLTNGFETLNYNVLSGDTLTSIASNIASSINANSALQNIGSHLVGSEGSIDAEVLVCGNSDDAVDEVIGLIGDLGLNCWHAGSIENSAAAEALTSVLIAINQKHKLKSSGIKITSH